MGARFERVSGEAAQAIEQQMTQGAALQPPTDAKRSKKNANEAYWTERVQVTEVESESTQSNAGDNHEVLTVGCTILTTRPNGNASGNEGRSVSFKGRLNWDAWANGNGDIKDGQFKMHKGTVGKMATLARAAGFYEGGDIEPSLWLHMFPEQGLSPLVGMEFDVEIKQKPNDDGRVFPEINRIILPDNIATPTAASVTNSAVVTL